MELKIFQVDAFTQQLFGGNPAAICPLEKWLPTEKMQEIAMENNLSETAFFVPEENHFHIRWFTPAIEVDLCGHATLATAHVLFDELGYEKDQIVFNSRSGFLKVDKNPDSYTMNFPSDQLQEIQMIPEIVEGLKITPKALFRGKDDYLAIFDSQEIIENLQPDFNILATLPVRGIIASAPGIEVDFVSRCFFPAAGINEDPVTGSAHTTLSPYWSKQLGKNELVAIQLSERQGKLYCNYLGARVNISGSAITYMKGSIFI
jgi:PhzF family phenazine biosynthesis protein